MPKWRAYIYADDDVRQQEEKIREFLEGGDCLPRHRMRVTSNRGGGVMLSYQLVQKNGDLYSVERVIENGVLTAVTLYRMEPVDL